MNSGVRLVYLALATLACANPAVSFAGKCSGTNINNVVTWDTTEIAKGTTLSLLRATSVTVSDDPKVPYHLAAGECIGTFLSTPDGKTQASGSCARKDKDGDVLNEEWIATDGTGGKGTSRNVGGSGKYANTSNRMEWAFSPLQGKMSAVRWTGDCP